MTPLVNALAGHAIGWRRNRRSEVLSATIRYSPRADPGEPYVTLGQRFGMIFNSVQYALFLPLVFGVYWLLKRREQNMLLLVASYYFYAAEKPRAPVVRGPR